MRRPGRSFDSAPRASCLCLHGGVAHCFQPSRICGSGRNHRRCRQLRRRLHWRLHDREQHRAFVLGPQLVYASRDVPGSDRVVHRARHPAGFRRTRAVGRREWRRVQQHLARGKSGLHDRELHGASCHPDDRDVHCAWRGQPSTAVHGRPDGARRVQCRLRRPGTRSPRRSDPPASLRLRPTHQLPTACC